MKYLLIGCFILSAIGGCKPKPKFDATVLKVITPEIDSSNFFPVTSYLRGQIREITDEHVNPLSITINGDKRDSVWLKIENLENEMKDFLHPEIDSANMKPFFNQDKFVDASLNAATFTYWPKEKLPDSLSIRKWDVYINPDDGKIIRIYLVKELPNGKQQQLTWNTLEKWYGNRIVGTDKNGNIQIEKEQKLTWNF